MQKKHHGVGRIAQCVLILTVAGCASLSPEQCRNADWRQIGFADGVKGISAARIEDHAEACANTGVRPVLSEYLRGRTEGLVSYCQPENGFNLGRNGSEQNAGDCREDLKPRFVDEYRRGIQIHAIEEEIARWRSRINDNDRKIRHGNERIATIRGELSRSDLPAERRTALLNEYNRLVEQKDFLGRENRSSANEVDHLQNRLQIKLREFGR